MSPERYTADTITDDALDALYENANRGWRRGDEWKARAEKAEGAIARLTAWCDELDEGLRTRVRDHTAEHPVAAFVRARLAEAKENSTT
jgi:hypothetical protein